MKSALVHQELIPAEVSPWTGHGGAIRPRDLWLILRQHRLTVALCGLLAVGAALLLCSQLTPLYEATATLRIDQRQPQLPALDVVWSMPGNNIGTEAEMLQSRSIAASVADSLGLRVRVASPDGLRRDSVFTRVSVAPKADTGWYAITRERGGVLRVHDRVTDSVLAVVPPSGAVDVRGAKIELTPAARRLPRLEFDVVSSQAAGDAIAGAVTVVQPSRDADVVQVSYRGPDPELVRDVANGLVAQFLSERQHSRQTSARSTARFVRDQITKVSDRLAAAEDSLRNYNERAGIVSIDDEASAAVRRRADLLSQRNGFESERIALDRMLADPHIEAGTIGTDTTRSYRDLVAFPSLLRNQAVGGLLQSLAQIEDRRADLLLRRRPEDPDVLVLTKRAADLERQLRSLALSYRQGLGNQVAAIDGILAQSNRSLAAIPAKQIQVARLEREVKGLQDIYEQLQTRLKEAEIAGAAEEDASVRLVDAAVLPTAPVRPRRNLIVLCAALVGTAAGFGLATVREVSNVTVRTRGDAELALGLPVLGVVPQIRRKRLLLPRMAGRFARRGRSPRALAPGRGATLQSPQQVESRARAAMFADVYNRLHTALLFARAPARLRTIVFTSPLPREGKTTSAANLALTLARHGMRILLVDADLRRGQVSTLLGARPGPGLCEVLTGEASIDAAVQRIELDSAARLDYLTAGTIPDDPLPLLGSGRVGAVLAELGERYDRVIVDTPPLNIVMDALNLGATADVVVLVARVGQTPAEALAYAGEQARNAGLPVAGVLLNDVDLDRYGASDSAYKWYAFGSEYYTSAASAP